MWGITIIPLLGTRWSYDPNPIGEASLWALIVGITIVVVCHIPKLDGHVRQAIVAVAPYGFLLLYADPPLVVQYMHHTDGTAYAPECVYLAFALGFALANIRYNLLLQQLNGVVMSAATLVLISRWMLYWTGWASQHGDIDMSQFAYRAVVACWTGWIILVIIELRYAAKDYVWRRKQAGLCTACSYDLRGNTDAANCPECGQPIAEGTRFEPIEHAPREP